MNDSIRETNFFTTAELAEKLKMNVQVITRKVKAGEIYAYKIGKDWRIPDSSVEQWLDDKANQIASDNSQQFENKTKNIVEERNKRKYLLEYILAQLEPAKDYTESDIKQIVSRQHKNWQEIYSDLLGAEMIIKDGRHLRRCEGYNLLTESV